MKRLILLLLIVGCGFAQTAEEVALKLENTLRSYQTFQADFEQFYYSSTITTPLHEKGKIYFKKPTLMRWEYKEPEEKIFLIKDDMFWDYNKEEALLTKYNLSDEEHNVEVISLLSGQVGLLDTYVVEFSPFPTDKKNVKQIKLTPKDEEYADAFLLLEIDEKTWQIHKMISFDWAGNKTEIHFSKFKRNTSLSDRTFELRVPPDTEIIENQEVREQ
jgi:outer membrane lipoprotein carrier protein